MTDMNDQKLVSRLVVVIALKLAVLTIIWFAFFRH